MQETNPFSRPRTLASDLLVSGVSTLCWRRSEVGKRKQGQHSKNLDGDSSTDKAAYCDWVIKTWYWKGGGIKEDAIPHYPHWRVVSCHHKQPWPLYLKPPNNH